MPCSTAGKGISLWRNGSGSARKGGCSRKSPAPAVGRLQRPERRLVVLFEAHQMFRNAVKGKRHANGA